MNNTEDSHIRKKEKRKERETEAEKERQREKFIIGTGCRHYAGKLRSPSICHLRSEDPGGDFNLKA